MKQTKFQSLKEKVLRSKPDPHFFRKGPRKVKLGKASKEIIVQKQQHQKEWIPHENKAMYFQPEKPESESTVEEISEEKSEKSDG